MSPPPTRPMKPKFIAPLLKASLVCAITGISPLSAADIYKYSTTGDLDELNSWSTTSSATQTAPGSFNNNDNWYFNEVALGATSGTVSFDLGGDITIGGLAVDTTVATGSGTPNIVINAGNTLTL